MRKGLKVVMALMLALALAIPFAACKRNNGAEAKDSYSVVYHMNYGDANTHETTVAAGRRASAYKATRTGYTLKGWYREVKCENAFVFSEPINSDLHLYAKWEKDADKVTVTFDFNDNSHSPEVVSVDSGKPIGTENIPYCPELGMKYEGWYKDKDCTQAWNMSTDKVTGHITLYAKYENDETVQRDEDDNIVFDDVTVRVYTTDLGYLSDLQELAEDFNAIYDSQIKVEITSDEAHKDYSVLSFAQTSGSNKEYASLVPAEDVYDFAGITYSADDWYKDATRNAYIGDVFYTVPVIAGVPCLIYNRQLMNEYNGTGALPSTYTEYKTLLDTVYNGEYADNEDFVKMVTATNWSFMETSSYAAYFQNGADYYAYRNGHYVNGWGDSQFDSFNNAVTSIENIYNILGGNNAERISFDVYNDDDAINRVSAGTAFMGFINMPVGAGLIADMEDLGILPLSGLFADSDKMYKDLIPVQAVGFQFRKPENSTATELAAAALFADYVSQHSGEFVDSGWYPLLKSQAEEAVLSETSQSAPARALRQYGNPENFRVHDGFVDEKTVFYTVGWDYIYEVLENYDGSEGYEFTQEIAEDFTVTVKEFIYETLIGAIV